MHSLEVIMALDQIAADSELQKPEDGPEMMDARVAALDVLLALGGDGAARLNSLSIMSGAEFEYAREQEPGTIRLFEPFNFAHASSMTMAPYASREGVDSGSVPLQPGCTLAKLAGFGITGTPKAADLWGRMTPDQQRIVARAIALHTVNAAEIWDELANSSDAELDDPDGWKRICEESERGICPHPETIREYNGLARDIANEIRLAAGT